MRLRERENVCVCVCVNGDSIMEEEKGLATKSGTKLQQLNLYTRVRSEYAFCGVHKASVGLGLHWNLRHSSSAEPTYLSSVRSAAKPTWFTLKEVLR